MGMGEPFLNYRALSGVLRILISEYTFNMSPRRITVSTSGIIPGIRKLGTEFPKINFAISLNATRDDQRARIMPISKKYPLTNLLDECRKYPLPRRKRLTIEYVMIKNLNDSRDDAKRLAGLLRGIKCKINLIPINASGLDSWLPPEDHTIEVFQKTLSDAGYTAILRKSKGSSIQAACGQLGSKNTGKKDLDS
jgi:23S rRNA (adenine2503-C2)-methyltransferase